MEKYHFNILVMVYESPFYVYSYFVVYIHSCELVTKQGNANFLLLLADI